MKKQLIGLPWPDEAEMHDLVEVAKADARKLEEKGGKYDFLTCLYIKYFLWATAKKPFAAVKSMKGRKK